MELICNSVLTFWWSVEAWALMEEFWIHTVLQLQVSFAISPMKLWNIIFRVIFELRIMTVAPSIFPLHDILCSDDKWVCWLLSEETGAIEECFHRFAHCSSHPHMLQQSNLHIWPPQQLTDTRFFALYLKLSLRRKHGMLAKHSWTIGNNMM